MALILNEKYAGHHFLFYSNRALKIFPVYWFNLLVLVTWGLFVYLKGYPSTFSFYHAIVSFKVYTLVFFIFSNLFIFGLDLFFFFGITNQGSLFFTKQFYKTDPNVFQFAFNSIAWTVSTELYFYLLAPFLVRKKLPVIFSIIFCSLILRIVLARQGMDDLPWTYMFFPSQLMLFFGGVVSYHIYLKVKCLEIKKLYLDAVFVLFICILIFYYTFFEEGYIKQAFLFLITLLSIPFIFIKFKHDKYDQFFAELSYPIYISQAFIIKITQIKFIPAPLGQGVNTIILDVLFSILLVKYIIDPIEKYRRLRVKKANAIALATSNSLA